MIICDITKFWSERAGGVRTYLTEKSKYFQKTDHRHILILPGKENSRETDGNVTMYRVRSPRLPWDGNYRFLFNAPAIRRILQEERPDIVELGDPYVAPWLVAWGARGLPVQRVAYFHADIVGSHLIPLIADWASPLIRVVEKVGWSYLRYVYSQVEATFAASDIMIRKLHGAGVSNIGIVPLGVDGHFFSPQMADENLRQEMRGGKQAAVLYVGRLSSEKGVKWLLSKTELLSHAGFRLTVIGDGPLKPMVEELAAKHPDRLAYLGFMKHSDLLAKCYASSDLFLSPGVHETFGISLLEAMASGKPIVVPEGTPGSLLARDGCGTVFSPQSDVSLVKALEQAFLHSKSMGNQARSKAVETYSWDRCFDTLCEQYGKILQTA
ncbi:MAG: glycosyltransferase [Deltaproteobacteria bacterium]|nr:glycosyltransferase [Deltaproteobacteria bacterium]